MSFRYSKVYPRQQPQKFYGFQKVKEENLREIIGRLQKPTITSLFQNDGWKLSVLSKNSETPMPTQPRPPSSKCRKDKVVFSRPSTAPAIVRERFDPSKVHYDERMIDRLVRRLQRPTLSKMIAEGTVDVEYDDETEIHNRELRQKKLKSRKDPKKALERVQRPTTASKRRIAVNESVIDNQADICLLKSKFSDVYRGEERFLTKKEEKQVISRVTNNSNVSHGGQTPCSKAELSEEPLTMAERHQYGLPLLCGLSRSQNTKEITERVVMPITRRSKSAPAKDNIPAEGNTPISIY